MTKEQIELVLQMLSSGDFECWYKDKFEDYIEGGLGSPTRKQILNWLSSHLGEK